MKVSLISSVLYQNDAISKSTRDKARAIEEICAADLRIFVHGADSASSAVKIASSPADVVLDPHFLASDLLIYDFGIYHSLFDSIHLAPRRARKLVHFHNITPRAFVAEKDRLIIDRSFEQLSNVLEADAALVSSAYNRDTLVEYGVEETRIKQLGYVVDGTASASGPRQGPVRLIFVGRFVASKGILDLLDAFAVALRRGAGSAHLSLAGSLVFSDKSYVETVQRRIADLRLGDAVEFLGEVSDEERDRLYSAADALVMPSYHEGFCMPVVEAYRHGCNVIAYDAGSLKDVVNGLGTLVPTGDKSRLADAIEHYVRKKLKSRGRSDGAVETQSGTIPESRFALMAREYAARFGYSEFKSRFASILHEVGILRGSAVPGETDSPRPRIDARISLVRDREMRQALRTSLNRLPDISDWRAGEGLSEIMRELGEGPYVHRKSWEYAMCIHGLRQLGVVRPEARAIAVGAGYERPLFYFANHISEMVATDLYDNAHHEGQPAMLTTPEKFAPFAYRKERLRVLRMDGTRLDFDEGRFDFAFSLSSIEHFGSRESSTRSVREICRVLKPGGVACLATELILNETTHQEYFTFDELNDVFIKSTPMRLVGGELDLRISRSLLIDPIDLVEEKALNVSPHIVLKAGDVVFTSIILFLQKPGARG